MWSNHGFFGHVVYRIYIFSENEEASVHVCPYTDKQRLIKIPLKCLKAFLAPAFIKIPTFSSCAIHISKFSWWCAMVYTSKWWYITEGFGLGFQILNLFLSPLHSLSLFLFLQLHPQTHFTCGSNVEENYTQIRVQYWEVKYRAICVNCQGK